MMIEYTDDSFWYTDLKYDMCRKYDMIYDMIWYDMIWYDMILGCWFIMARPVVDSFANVQKFKRYATWSPKWYPKQL